MAEAFFSSKQFNPNQLVESNFNVADTGEDERIDNLRAFAIQSRNQLRMKSFELIGQKKTVENMRQVEAINQSYGKLAEFIEANSSVDNDKAIDAFARQEAQRIKFFGGKDNNELNLMLDSLVTTARKHNLNIGITDNEANAWQVLKEKKTDIMTAITKEDHNKIVNGLDDLKSKLTTLVMEGVIADKRAGLYLNAIEKSVAKSIVGISDDRVNLLMQTEGMSSANKYMDTIKSTYKDMFDKLPPDLQSAWIKKTKGLKEASLDLDSVSKNFIDVEKNFHQGYGSIDGLIDTSKNYIKLLNTAIKEGSIKNRPKFVEAKNDAIGRLMMSEAIQQEFIDVKEGAKASFQLLNPYKTPAELANIMATLVDGSQNQTDGAVNAMYDMRAKFLSSLQGTKPENVHAKVQALLEKLDSTVGYSSPHSLFKPERTGILGLPDRIQNEKYALELIDLPYTMSKNTSDIVKQFVLSPKTPEQSAQFRQVTQELLDNGIDIKKQIIQHSNNNVAKVTTDNYVNFINDFGIYFPNASSAEGQNQIKTFLDTNNSDFNSLVEKSFNLLTNPETLQSLQVMSQANGYPVDTILTAMATDVAVGIMNNQFGMGPGVFKKLSTGAESEDVESGFWKPVTDYVNENLDQLTSVYDKVGRTFVVNDSFDIFSGRSELDQKVLGAFDKPLSDTGFFERKGETIKDVFGTAIKNLEIPAQRRLESFVSSFLPRQDTKLSGRLLLTPSSNGFYRVGFDNGFGGNEFITYNNKPLVINPAFYRQLSAQIDDPTDDQVSDFLIEVITLSNQVPRLEEYGNL